MNKSTNQSLTKSLFVLRDVLTLTLHVIYLIFTGLYFSPN